MRHFAVEFLAGTALLVLAAGCGGGGGSSATSPVQAPVQSPVQPNAGDEVDAPLAKAQTSGVPSITLGAEEQLLTIGQYGLKNVPDEHLAVRLRKDGLQYRAWLTGSIGSVSGSVAEMQVTQDLATFTPLVQSGGVATPVFGASAPGTTAFDADYAGPGAVLRVKNDPNLLMIYHGENHTFNGMTYPVVPFYATVGLATSSDHGTTWVRQGAIIAGVDPQPAVAPTPSGMGAAIPTAIATGGFIYVYYTDYPVPGGPNAAAGMIMVAQAPASSGGAPGTWKKYYQGSFSQDALAHTKSTPVVPNAGSGCTQPERQAGITHNRFLGMYLMTFTCNEGWFFATSSDLVTWSTPTQFFTAPHPNNSLATGQEFDWYPTLATPGEKTVAQTNKTGYVYYTKGLFNQTAHILYRRSYTLSKMPSN